MADTPSPVNSSALFKGLLGYSEAGAEHDDASGEPLAHAPSRSRIDSGTEFGALAVAVIGRADYGPEDDDAAGQPLAVGRPARGLDRP